MHPLRRMKLKDVQKAHKVIESLVNLTPVLLSDTLSSIASSPDLKIKFFLKCENLQKAGSFKFRGASNFIAQQSDEELQNGLVAISTGNFGQAVALAAKTAAHSRGLAINTSVVLPLTSASSKVAGAKRNGATVVLAGTSPDEREQAAKRICKEKGATIVGPMDDPRIVLGQATTTLELITQIANADGRETLDALVLPSATGGLLAGSGIVCEDTKTLVFGCEPRQGGPDLQHGIRTGILSKPKSQDSVADGLRASTASGNFDLIRQKHLVAGLYTATEREIKEAWRLLIEQLHLVVEPSSAVALAVILFNEEFRALLTERKVH